MPFVHPERRLDGGGSVDSYADELPMLRSAGIRAVVSLLNIPSDAKIFDAAGFSFLCLPMADGGAPTLEQAEEFIRFVNDNLARQKPVAVHCEAGLGRTGTMLALFFVSQGADAESAIRRIREVERAAVETNRQVDFIYEFAGRRGRV